LLDPKWRGKLVKAHPSYSGAILTVGRVKPGNDTGRIGLDRKCSNNRIAVIDGGRAGVMVQPEALAAVGSRAAYGTIDFIRSRAFVSLTQQK
jgi:hypothetical protein